MLSKALQPICLRSWQRLDAFALRRPIFWAIFTAGIKGTAGDAVAQLVVEGKDWKDFSIRRSLVYTTFSGLYLGGVQYFVQCRLLERMFVGRTALQVAKKVAFDQFLHLPLIAFPCLYLIKAVFLPETGVVTARFAQEAMLKYRSEAVTVNMALWKFWIPVCTVGFAFIPTHWRIPYNAGASFFWTIILSTMQTRLDEEKKLEK